MTPPLQWNVRSLLAWAREYFENKEVDSPRLTAEILLCHAIGVKRVQLYVDPERPLQPDELKRLRALIERRAAGEPIQYITGRVDFYGRDFHVDRRCFIPRPETEGLAARAVSALPKDADGLRVLDLCTGSGAIAATVACERPRAAVTAVELSPDALAIARENCERLAPGRVRLLEGDLFAPLEPGETFHVIASNPPYLPSTKPVMKLVADHEPHLALFGGPDGLDVLRRLVPEARRHLVPGGRLAVEIDEAEGDDVRALFVAAGFAGVEVEADLAGLPRIVTGIHPQ